MLLRESAREEPEGTPSETEQEAEEKFYCARCGRLITEGRFRIAVDGAHEHSRFNPVGLRFVVVLFKEAPGIVITGRATSEFTWFSGYTWEISVCGGCRTHLGWRYRGADRPKVFFGLIRDRLTTVPPGGSGD